MVDEEKEFYSFLFILFKIIYWDRRYRKTALLTLYNLVDEFKQLFDPDLVIYIEKYKNEASNISKYLDFRGFAIWIFLLFLFLMLKYFGIANTFTVVPILLFIILFLIVLLLRLFVTLNDNIYKKYRFNQNDSKEVKDEKQLHRNYLRYRTLKIFSTMLLLFLIPFLVIFIFIILSINLLVYEIISFVALVALILLLIYIYESQQTVVCLYENELFKLKKFKINIKVLTKQEDSISGRIDSVGCFLILKNINSSCAIKWGDIERICYLGK
jgi:hypothetical protein